MRESGAGLERIKDLLEGGEEAFIEEILMVDIF